MYGFVKLAAAVPSVRVADCYYNKEQILKQIQLADQEGVQVIGFPELCITGYTCADLFFQTTLLESAKKALGEIAKATKKMEMLIVLGLPLMIEDELYNCATVLLKGKVLGVVPKSYIPNYNEFYEKRWFALGTDLGIGEMTLLGEKVPVGTDLLFECGELKVGVEICEDVWTPIPPSSLLALAGANVIVNLSASNEIIAKRDYRRQLVSQQSARTLCAYLYVSAGAEESTTDLVFSGHSLIAENGAIKKENKKLIDTDYVLVEDVDLERLQKDRIKGKSYGDSRKFFMPEVRRIEGETLSYRGTFKGRIARKPFVPHATETRDKRCEDIFSLQVAGLKKRLSHTGSKRAIIGISGGLDSTLALLVAVQAFDDLGWDRKGVVGVTMPGFGTTDRTYENALQLMRELGITMREIPIAAACKQHFSDIGHDENVHDITYENTQARERTKILMNIANQGGGMVVGTGDLSELALGWCTYNGDHMSMYAVNTSVPKTLVRSLVYTISKRQSEKVKDTLIDVLDTPVSPELLPVGKNGEMLQKTEDTVGPYELHDFFLYYLLRFGFSPSKIYFLAKTAFAVKEEETDELYSHETILKWLKVFYRRFFSQQFKRSCLPDGPKIGSICLSPRGDWRMPSDACSSLWLSEIEELSE
ncbi:NAD(+) synthase [Cellulosilyticum sp. ST5]|uniref:NAD(+) synthase n=1 Tax=Cellulosilyticum sp. ST5 TaxID=3055805 RepID=UPI0039777BDB